MDTKLKKFSHSIFVKTIVFLMLIGSVAGSIYAGLNIFKLTNGNLEIIFENSYIDSTSFRMEYGNTVNQLIQLIDVYKSEENILAGHTIDNDELESRMDEMYWDDERGDYWETITTSEAYAVEEVKQDIIANDLESFKTILRNLDREKELLYYATDGKHILTNTNQTEREQFEKYPVYYISEDDDWEIHPNKLEQGHYSYGFPNIYRSANPENTKIFVGYTEDHINTISTEWSKMKADSMSQVYYLLAYVALFFISLLYLIVTTGRYSFKDEEAHMHLIDKLYVDLNLIIMFGITVTWFLVGYDMSLYWGMANWFVYVITLPVVSILAMLFLSLIRHLKNKTFFKHSLSYTVFHSIYKFIKAIYDSGSLGVKIVVVVILYPMITAATLFFFPITIAVAAWLALKQVRHFKEIQEGAKLMNEGKLDHQIKIDGTGEFAKLAANINGINENFKQAVHNELKNERMKTELITNVSHDIRTPLTSLITYTDLLKTETDPDKIQEYIEILDQKSKRLKVLTDDLFSAAKASSGDIPVDLQRIDVVALINQGIGEVSEQISEKNLTFKVNYTAEKMYVTADGKLLWRSIENILANIFNYALEGSRVYIDITSEGDQTLISFKNISKYELNITEDELMERFKRGDESRASQGSGLGLSITKSLIENQHGQFEINIDGDLFKSMIYLPNAENAETSEVSF